MAVNEAHSRWQRMKVPTLLIAATIVTFGLLVGGLVWHEMRRLRVQTISARLTSAGNVIWGDRQVDVNAIGPELQRSTDLLRSHGFKPRLLIEHYRDTRDADIAALARIGHDAGFVIVDTRAHNWPSPPTAEGGD